MIPRIILYSPRTAKNQKRSIRRNFRIHIRRSPSTKRQWLRLLIHSTLQARTIKPLPTLCLNRHKKNRPIRRPARLPNRVPNVHRIRQPLRLAPSPAGPFHSIQIRPHRRKFLARRRHFLWPQRNKNQKRAVRRKSRRRIPPLSRKRSHHRLRPFPAALPRFQNHAASRRAPREIQSLPVRRK